MKTNTHKRRRRRAMGPLAAGLCILALATLSGRQAIAESTNIYPANIQTNWWWRSCNAEVAWQAWGTARDQQPKVVAIVDTAIDFHHPQLSNRLWTNWAEVFGDPTHDDDKNGYTNDVNGWSFLSNRPLQVAVDPEAHGTMVAGLVSGEHRNNRRSAGFAPNGRLMIIQYTTDGSTDPVGQLLRLSQAVEYGLLNQANIINISSHITVELSNPAHVQAMLSLSNLLASATASNVLIVSSVPALSKGDLDDVSVNRVIPATFEHPNIITVTGLKSGNPEKMLYKAGRKAVDIAAPADDIVSLKPGNGEWTHSGPSYATAIVSGAAALVWGMMPKLTAREVRCLLLSNAATNNVELAPPGGGREWGHTPPAKPNSKLDLSFVTNVYPSYLAYQAGQPFTNCCFGLTEQQNGCRETQ